jgi:hypothetical protein
MTKLIALSLFAVSLAACSSMNGTRSMGNTATPAAAPTQNSTDANKSANPAAVSPGTGTGTGTGTGK